MVPLQRESFDTKWEKACVCICSVPNTITVHDNILHRKQWDLLHICISWSSLSARHSLAHRLLMITIPCLLCLQVTRKYLASEPQALPDRYFPAVSCHLTEGICIECDRTCFEPCYRETKWNDCRKQLIGSKFTKYLTQSLPTSRNAWENECFGVHGTCTPKWRTGFDQRL